MTDKLGLYNGALRVLGETRLADLNEDREARYELDQCFDKVVAKCLENGQWDFSLRAVAIDKDVATANWGFQNRFSQPDDFLALSGIYPDSSFTTPLTNFRRETTYFWADIDPLYLVYVSNGTDYGLKYSVWPSTFQDYVHAELAYELCETIRGEHKERVEKILKKAKSNALNKDAINQPVKRFPMGSWASSKYGGSEPGNKWSR